MYIYNKRRIIASEKKNPIQELHLFKCKHFYNKEALWLPLWDFGVWHSRREREEEAAGKVVDISERCEAG